MLSSSAGMNEYALLLRLNALQPTFEHLVDSAWLPRRRRSRWARPAPTSALHTAHPTLPHQLPPTHSAPQKKQGEGAPWAPQEGEEDAFPGIAHQGLREVLVAVRERDPHQPEFLSAVVEVAASLQPLFERRPELLAAFRTLCEPERQVRRAVAEAPALAAITLQVTGEAALHARAHQLEPRHP